MKHSAPAALRNREPIAAVLAEELPASGTVLEVASGTGEHAVHFASEFPALAWQPSDPDEVALESIAAWREEAGLANLLPPLALDAAAPEWPLDAADAVVCINMIHISPWTSAEGLFAGAARLLPKGAPLLLYGPFLEDDVPTAPSNIAFDAWLKGKDPAYGIRRIEEVDALAARHGFARTRRTEMPANNLTLAYRKR
jgi:ubiquinone/menaquinone biosynthesis C-methylase UbiE